MTALSRLRSRRACRAGLASFRRRRPGACRHRPRHHAGLTLIRIEGVAVPIHRTILSASLLVALALAGCGERDAADAASAPAAAAAAQRPAERRGGEGGGRTG